MAKISVTGLNPRIKPLGDDSSATAHRAAALHRAHIASIDGYWTQQDVALAIALGMIVYQKFVQDPPQ